jgi:hypothetical protein
VLNLNTQETILAYLKEIYKRMVLRVSKNVFLVFGIISTVSGAILLFIFGFLLKFGFDLEAEYPGPDIVPAVWVVLYSGLIIGIILICVGILLLILRARRSD